MLHYDTKFNSAYDRPVNQNVNWLGFTHGLTFANAVRVLCTKYPHLWPQALLQMACFVGRNRSFLDMDVNEGEWMVTDREAFFQLIFDTALNHGFRAPICSAHVLKTPIAIEEELDFASPSTQKYLLAAFNRFLNSPLQQKHVRRLARQAIALVKRDF